MASGRFFVDEPMGQSSWLTNPHLLTPTHPTAPITASDASSFPSQSRDRRGGAVVEDEVVVVDDVRAGGGVLAGDPDGDGAGGGGDGFGEGLERAGGAGAHAVEGEEAGAAAGCGEEGDGDEALATDWLSIRDEDLAAERVTAGAGGDPLAERELRARVSGRPAVETPSEP